MYGSGFMVQGSGFMVQGSGFRAQGLGLWGLDGMSHTPPHACYVDPRPCTPSPKSLSYLAWDASGFRV